MIGILSKVVAIALSLDPDSCGGSIPGIDRNRRTTGKSINVIKAVRSLVKQYCEIGVERARILISIVASSPFDLKRPSWCLTYSFDKNTGTRN